MKKIIFILILSILTVITGCSKDDSNDNNGSINSCNQNDFPDANYYCNLTGPYSQAEECTIYIGESWTEPDASEACSTEGYSSPINPVSSSDICACEKPVAGYCLKPKDGKEALTVYFFEGAFVTGEATEAMIKGICESNYNGTWTSGGQAPEIKVYPLMDEAYTAMDSTASVTVTPECTDVADDNGTIACLQTLLDNDDYITFSPVTGDPTSGLVIYPGAGVDPRAYAPAAQLIAEDGYKVFIMPMTDNFPLPEYDKAGNIIADVNNADIVNWFLVGHSMGGTAAAAYILENPDDIDGLIMWGSYTDGERSLSSTAVEVISIHASRDGLSTVEEVTETYDEYLPSDTKYYNIIGGNHAQFGYYGVQSNDLDAGISREHQHTLFTSATIYHMKSVITGQGYNIDSAFSSVAAKESSWPEEIQLIVGNVDAGFTTANIEDVTYDNMAGGFVDSKAAIDTETGIVTTRSFQFQYGNADDLTIPPIYTGEFWVKSKIQDNLISELGYTAVGGRQYCEDVNEAIITWAFNDVLGDPGSLTLPTFDDASYATGGEWVPSELTFTEDGGVYTLTSPYLEVEPTDDTAPTGGQGVIYCKVWGPARALIWALNGE